MISLSSALPAAIGGLACLVYVKADGTRPSPDGLRYTSGEAQPSPFSRRFCGWPPRVLMAANYLAIVALATSLGDWKKAAMFVTLPGVWFLATRPRCVDAVAISLAVAAAHAWHHDAREIAIAFTLLAGLIHERGPIYAAAYAWDPLLLVGLFASGWWRTSKPGAAGVGFFTPQDVAAPSAVTSPSLLTRLFVRLNPGAATSEGALRSQELLDWRTHVLPLRGAVFLAAWQGASPSAWLSLGIAYAGRLVATDPGRAMVWAAYPLLASSSKVPGWFLAAHLVTFQRMS